MNSSIQTPDEVLAAIAKPPLEPVEQFVLSPEDWLVVCGGFEDRALAVLESAATSLTPFNVILVLYEPFVAQNRADDIREICRTRSLKIVELSYNRQEPAGFGDVLVEKIPNSNGRIFIDISSMSRLLIVQTLVALKEYQRNFSNSYIAYTEAQTYSPTQEQAATSLAKSDSDPSFPIFFLSSGVFDVTIVPELSSYAPTGVHTRLIAFPSPDSHQLTALRAELQPSRLSFIEGIPPASHNHWRREAIAKANGLHEIQDGQAEMYQTCTLDYRETLTELLKIYAEHGIYERLVISPTGSKMQAVAVGLLRSFMEDIQIAYPTPRDFLMPERYTDGIGEMHLLSLEPFSENDSSEKSAASTSAK